MKPYFFLLTTCLACFVLNACSPYTPRSGTNGMRNELNSEIIFNGATSNDREAELENAQKPLEMRSYDKMTTPPAW